MARKIVFNTYDTAAKGWTLNSCELTAPEYVQRFVSVPWRDGAVDFSGANGEVSYNSRTLTARLECSEGTRTERLALVSDMVNQLNGKNVSITLPDRTGYTLTGRLSVAEEYNTPYQCAVVVTAICAPWFVKNTETTETVTATSTLQTVTIANAGRRTVVPKIVNTAAVHLELGSDSIDLTAGTHYAFTFPGGDNILKYKGSGTVTVSFKEAIL